MNHGLILLVAGQGAEVAHGKAPFATGFVQQAGDAELPAVLLQADGLAIALGAAAHVVLKGGQEAVAPAAPLPSDLGGAQQVRGTP